MKQQSTLTQKTRTVATLITRQPLHEVQMNYVEVAPGQELDL